MGRVRIINQQSLSDMIKEIERPKSDSRAPSGRVHPLVRAFRVEVTDWPEATCIVRTVKASRAKFLSWAAAKEAGYNLPFGRFRVRRAPDHDGTVSLLTGRCYTLEHAETLFT